MKQLLQFAIFILILSLPGIAQEARVWNESDRKYLLENLASTRNELIRETASLTNAQWNFKESPQRWSVKK